MTSITQTIFVFSLVFLSPALSYSFDQGSESQSSEDGTYDPKFRKNYKKYKAYSPAKKQRMQKLHKSVESLSPEQKRKLRERVLNKNKPNY